jgi:putative DNA base modification enzyme with NMAD domain
MQVVLLRVGIDTGSGGILGPLFADGSFEFVPIPDKFKGKVDKRTYGSIRGRSGERLIDFFPESRRPKNVNQSVHLDPEFREFTYGDPTPPKRSLRKLKKGDLLVFYAGLKGWDFESPPALYIVGFFEVAKAGLAKEFTRSELQTDFKNNFHVRNIAVFKKQKNELVLVKGSKRSRLLTRAFRISVDGIDRNGTRLHRLSSEMQKVFGDFGGKTSIQRCPPRRVRAEFVDSAAQFVKSLR